MTPIKLTLTKICIGLAGALALSVTANIFQLVSYVRHAATAPLELQIESLTATEAINTAVAKQRESDSLELEKLRLAIENAPKITVTKFRDRIVRVPDPSCSPGTERVEVWNKLSEDAP